MTGGVDVTLVSSERPESMTFQSLLFPAGMPGESNKRTDPATFADLHIDRLIANVVKGREEYDLPSMFADTLDDAELVRYRQDVFHELEETEFRESIDAFAAMMRSAREWLALAAKSSYEHERNRWILDAAHLYYEQVERLRQGLSHAKSRGLAGLRDFLETYVRSEPFRQRSADAQNVASALSRIQYRVIIGGTQVTVRGAAPGADLVDEVNTTFARFRQGAVESYLLTFRDAPLMNHVEAKVLEFVAKLNSDQFDALRRFANAHATFMDPTIERVDREFQFYLALIEYFEAFGAANVPTCYPAIARGKSTRIRGGYEAVLAGHLIASGGRVIRNDVELTGAERILVISGPNQGGKTTFARMFGQIHYLATLGCRVPAEAAEVVLCDRLFSHFEREEDAGAQRGKLEDDLLRTRAILDEATSQSIIILNELFSSTTAQDAGELSRRVLESISGLDAFCVCVTFIDELAVLNEKTVSMVALIDPERPEQRTFSFARRPPDGLAYALSLARKYGLTHDRLLQRLPRPETK